MEIKYHSKYMTIGIDKIKKYVEIRRTILTEYQSDKEYKNEVFEMGTNPSNRKNLYCNL